jgi:protein-disulfide isomerase
MVMASTNSARWFGFEVVSGGALALLLLVSGCSSDLPKLSAAGSAATAQPIGLGLSPEEVAASGPSVVTNPFQDMTVLPTGGREVIASPTIADVLQPVPGLPEIAFGQADAPVTVVQYASLTCPYCKRFHTEVYPAFKREYIDTGKVRYILRDFPIGRQSGQGSVALRCAAPEKYLDLYGRFLDQQPAWVSQEVRVDAVFAVAAQAGVSRADYDACRTNVALVENIKAIKDRGRKLGIIGTPNFFIDNKLVKKALDMAELRAMIDPLLVSRTAGAPPSSVSLPQ